MKQFQNVNQKALELLAAEDKFTKNKPYALKICACASLERNEFHPINISAECYGENMGGKPAPTFNALQKIRSIANYQFGKGAGRKLFPKGVMIVYSRRTGKIRHVYLEKKMLATLRPTDGLFSLTITGAKQIMEPTKPQRLRINIKEEAVPFVVKGRSVFAKHVTDADEEIRPQEEVVVISDKGAVLAVGRAMLSGSEMKAYRRGVAVRVRRGAAEES